MLTLDPVFWLSVAQIIGIDVLLSGDNAVVIAMACRSLPPKQRAVGITLGVALALALRIVAAAAIVYLLAIPLLKAAGGLLLFYIAVDVLKQEGEDEGKGHREAGTLLHAILLIVVADITMSLDNVVAIAGAANGDDLVFIIGLACSMPLMIVGASLISGLMTRFPLIVWAGAGLLGWIAGGMIASDPYVAAIVSLSGPMEEGIGAALVIAVGAALRWLPRIRLHLGSTATGRRRAPGRG